MKTISFILMMVIAIVLSGCNDKNDIPTRKEINPPLKTSMEQTVYKFDSKYDYYDWMVNQSSSTLKSELPKEKIIIANYKGSEIEIAKLGMVEVQSIKNVFRNTIKSKYHVNDAEIVELDPTCQECMKKWAGWPNYEGMYLRYNNIIKDGNSMPINKQLVFLSYPYYLIGSPEVKRTENIVLMTPDDPEGDLPFNGGSFGFSVNYSCAAAVGPNGTCGCCEMTWSWGSLQVSCKCGACGTPYTCFCGACYVVTSITIGV